MTDSNTDSRVNGGTPFTASPCPRTEKAAFKVKDIHVGSMAVPLTDMLNLEEELKRAYAIIASIDREIYDGIAPLGYEPDRALSIRTMLRLSPNDQAHPTAAEREVERKKNNRI